MGENEYQWGIIEPLQEQEVNRIHQNPKIIKKNEKI